ncbi:MAG: transporter substrate-binding domain-containing protein [Oligoflexia bacterium]|nr:transporter substrate-binding domain-containing protein [Oligoflexia bacterium]
MKILYQISLVISLTIITLFNFNIKLSLAGEVSEICKNKIISLAANESPPLASSELGSNKGLLVDIITDAFKEMGCTIEVTFLPWMRGEKMLNAGKIWGLFPAYKTSTREKSYLFSDEIIKTKNYFYYFKQPKLTRFTVLQELKKFKIGGTLGYFYIPLFKDAGLDVEYARSDLNNLHKLHKGRIDFFLLNEFSARYLLRSNFRSSAYLFGRLENNYLENEIKIMISKNYKNSTEILAIFNEGLSKLKAKPSFKNILNELELLKIPSSNHTNVVPK